MVVFVLVVVASALYIRQQRLIVSFQNSQASHEASSITHLPGWQTHDELVQQHKLAPLGSILEFQFEYHAAALPPLTLIKVKRKNGYAPTYEPVANGYVLEILDSNQQVMNRLDFEVPKLIHALPPLPGQEQDPGELVLSDVSFSLTLPWVPEVAFVRLRNPDQSILGTELIARVPYDDNHPTSHSIKGNELLEISQPTSWLRSIFYGAHAATTDGRYLDIAFIGARYTPADLTKFHNDVSRFSKYLLTVEPFKSRASQIYFHYVDNTADLGCTYQGRLLICNQTLAIAAVTSAGVPYDKVVVIVNSSIYGGSGGDLTVAYDGTDYGSQVFVHEFGHSLGRLLDEYNLYTAKGTIDTAVRANCYAGVPPALTWQSLVPPTDYRIGCDYPNWYRSSPSSIMLTLATPYFNAVSKRLLDDHLTYFAGPLPISSPTPTPTTKVPHGRKRTQ